MSVQRNKNKGNKRQIQRKTKSIVRNLHWLFAINYSGILATLAVATLSLISGNAVVPKEDYLAMANLYGYHG